MESPGLPIICSDRGPMSEILKEARIYFNHEVSSGIAATVPSLLIYHKLRGKITSNTYLLSYYYSRVKCAMLTLDFLKNIAVSLQKN